MAEQAAGTIDTAAPSVTETTTKSLNIGERGRVEAAAQAWKWREKSTDSSETDQAAALRRKGALQGAVGLGIAAIFYFALGWQTMAMVVTAIASLTLLTAMISPTGAYAAIERALTQFAVVVGNIVAWLVLMPIFLGFFVPFGLLFRRGENDSMKRLFAPSAPSYWREREADTDMEGRRRSQF